MSRRSTTEAIHLLQNLMEKYRERQRDLHMAFLNLEKAYDSVPSFPGDSREHPLEHGFRRRYCVGCRIGGWFKHKTKELEEGAKRQWLTGWVRWRAASGVLCDRRIPLKLKGKFYRVAIKPTMLYGSECWLITKAQADRVEVAELRMLRWTCGKTMIDMLPNAVFREELEVESIIHKMKEERLRWFGHFKRRPQIAPVKRVC
ncbi:hypothetical protein Tco_0577738 [Tanacetum coccineum]